MAGARGEGAINANGREVRLLMTNRAIADAEEMLKKGIIGVLQGFETGESGIKEVAVLLQVGMEYSRRDAREGGRRVTLTDAYDVLDECGFAAVAAPVMEAVAAVLSYEAGDASIGEADESEPDPNR